MSSPTKRKAPSSNPTQTPKGNALSTQTIEYLRAWMMSPEHIEHPYPTEQEKEKIMQDTGITAKQLTCWFSNNRKRFWKPKMEEMGKHDVVEAAMGNTLTPQTIEYLKAWMMSPEHVQNPYPTEEEKTEIIRATGIEKKQLTCWFSNNRKRFWKPQMDKIRKQYGLSESDALPAALLATAATPTVAPSSDPTLHHGQDLLLAVATAVSLPPSGDLYAAAAPAALSFGDPATAPQAAQQVAELPSGFPLEDMPSYNFYASINAAAEEVVAEAQAEDNKRQKVSMDDVVAV